MSKAATTRRLPANATSAKLVGLRTSAQKARLVLDAIRGKPVEQAFNVLTFMRQKTAAYALQLLRSAVANAENNHRLNVDQLYVAAAFADKGFVMKRGMPRGRGRYGKILKPTCQLTVVVAERAAVETRPTKAKSTQQEATA